MSVLITFHPMMSFLFSNNNVKKINESGLLFLYSMAFC